ncbi:LysM peptidoglycan-binding domain-containing protein [Vermiculatibacterium agrestimuris]|uniref:LysM peptidoglycan-binding domain-containing protein n=1 Tax=Vermiculatibacterium agrestimuris TaxID=2941519 RepID=UPI002041F1AA|nr:LysM peptidoglycan-binding domain-containing protein [Vermiculatibacterium agrestimuris]
MELAPMRYKDFVWPHNPRVYTIEYKREMGLHKVPFGRYHLQDLGPTRRVMKGQGEFVGEKAYETFQALACVFYQEGPGVLVHPVWQAANAYFVELSLAQEPRKDYVKYTFTFWEGYNGYQPYARSALTYNGGGTAAVTQSAGTAEELWHTVAKGECLWNIAQRYGKTVTEVIALNPQIKNPNLIYPGERVRLQ